MIVLAGLFFDVVIYTIWLKRRTPYSIIVGGLAGGMPALAGRTLGTGRVDLLGLLLALAVLLWIPTHIVTFGVRYPVLVLVSRTTLPRSVLDALKFIPTAVLTAIIVPAVLMPGGQLDVSFANAYLVAGLSSGGRRAAQQLGVEAGVGGLDAVVQPVDAAGERGEVDRHRTDEHDDDEQQGELLHGYSPPPRANRPTSCPRMSSVTFSPVTVTAS